MLYGYDVLYRYNHSNYISNIFAFMHASTTSNLIEVVISPPSLYLLSLKDTLRGDFKVAAQNCYLKESGAFTGEIR